MTLQQALNEGHQEVTDNITGGHVALPYTVEVFCNRRPVRARNGRYVDGPWRVGVVVSIQSPGADRTNIASVCDVWAVSEYGQQSMDLFNSPVEAFASNVWKLWRIHLEQRPIILALWARLQEAVRMAKEGKLPGEPTNV